MSVVALGEAALNLFGTAAASEGNEGSLADSCQANRMPDRWQHPPSFYCPISQQCMHDPVVLSDGHSYERRHIQRWLEQHNTSPVSGLQLPAKATFPNHALRNAIEEYFQQVFSVHRRAIRKTMAGPDLNTESMGSDDALLRTIDALMQCSLLVSADLSTECVLRQIMDEAKMLLGTDAASVFLVDAVNQQLYSTVNSTGEEIRIPLSAGIAGHVATTGEPLVIHNAYDDARFSKVVDKKTGFRTRNMICAPLKLKKGGVIGVVQLINKTSAGSLLAVGKGSARKGSGKLGLPALSEDAEDVTSFTADDLHFLQVFASQAATALANSGACEQPAASSEAALPASASSSWSLDDMVKKPQEISPKAQEMLDESFHSWQLDTLALAAVTDNKPLSSLATYLFDSHGLVERFGLDRMKLQNFLEAVERGYDETVPYHNNAHAAAVLHGMHALLLNCGWAKAAAAAFSPDDASADGSLETMACLIAAAVHDYEHRGLNNDFLVKTADERALRYNDQHVNENHHAAAAFELLQKPENDFLEALPSSSFARLRNLVIELVLGTDMAKSGSLLGSFKEALDDAEKSASAKDASDDRFQPTTPRDATLLLQMAMKCADLGHLALPWDLHNCWVSRLETEFFAQGDKEKEAGLPVSFLMDRNKPGASQTQVGFFDFVVLPLFRALRRGAGTAAEPLLGAVEANYAAWKDLQAPVEAPDPAPAEEVALPTGFSFRSDCTGQESEAVQEGQGEPGEGLAVRKKRSGRARQRAAKFWRTVRARTPSPEIR